MGTLLTLAALAALTLVFGGRTMGAHDPMREPIRRHQGTRADDRNSDRD